MDYFTLTGASERIQDKNAQLSLYYDKGYMGMFSCKDKQSGLAIIKTGIAKLQAMGHKKIIAPIDGNTWFSYRLLSNNFTTMPVVQKTPEEISEYNIKNVEYTIQNNTQSAKEKRIVQEAPFPLELQNPLWYNEIFLELGFSILSKYHSYAFDFPRHIHASNLPNNIMIRSLKKENIMQELETIYHLSTQSFDNNFLYDKISFEKFSTLYASMLPMLEEDLVCIAQKEQNGIVENLGFLFAFSDRTNIQSEKVQTTYNLQDTHLDDQKKRLIIKSMAVHKDFLHQGIGSSMLNFILKKSQSKGFSKVIAAYIREENFSANIMAKYTSKSIREYSLYALDLS